MGGRHGSAHYHTETLQMASITVECAELAVGALGGKMSNMHHPAANPNMIHSFPQPDLTYILSPQIYRETIAKNYDFFHVQHLL